MIESETENLPDPKLMGYLIIYVDGYRMVSKNTTHFFQEGDNVLVVPDRLIGPPRHKIGSDDWWEEGWAVGDNSRGRLCKRFGSSGCMRFHDYDKAISFISSRQPRFKAQQHVLVYVTKGVAGKERLYVVRSLDEIDEIEAKLVVEIAKSDAELAQQEADWNARYPHLKTLQEQFGKSMAMSLSYLLNDIRDKGLEAAKAGRPKATFTRHLAKLKEVGLIE